MNFKGKTIVVTGAASGIGLATVKAFAEAGGRVVLTDVNAAAGEAAAKEAASAGDVRFMPLDVTDRVSAEALAQRIEAELGRLDVLVNAAGWDIIQPFMDNTPEYWAKIVSLNFMGPVQVTRALLPLLIAFDIALLAVAAAGGWLGSQVRGQVAVVRSLPSMIDRRRKVQSSARISPAEFAPALTTELDSPYLGAAARIPGVQAVLRLIWAIARPRR